MKNIVDETGEIIAKATDDHTLIGGHHRLAVVGSPFKTFAEAAAGVTLTPGGTGETNPAGISSTYRRRTMWRMSNAQALIFVAVAVVVAVALLELLAR